MSEDLCLAPLLESYFRRRLAKQRNATPATMASYRDALRMLILFAAGCTAVAGVVFLRNRTELWIQIAGGGLVLASLSALLG